MSHVGMILVTEMLLYCMLMTLFGIGARCVKVMTLKVTKTVQSVTNMLSCHQHFPSRTSTGGLLFCPEMAVIETVARVMKSFLSGFRTR